MAPDLRFVDGAARPEGRNQGHGSRPLGPGGCRGGVAVLWWCPHRSPLCVGRVPGLHQRLRDHTLVVMGAKRPLPGLFSVRIAAAG